MNVVVSPILPRLPAKRNTPFSIVHEIKTTNTPLPKAEIAANEVLSIPMHTELMQDQMDYIITTVKNFYSCYI